MRWLTSLLRNKRMTFLSPRLLTNSSMRVLSRQLTQSEQDAFMPVLARATEYYEAHVDDSARYTTVGQQLAPERESAAETAAWMTVSSMFLNLDEAMTRE